MHYVRSLISFSLLIDMVGFEEGKLTVDQPPCLGHLIMSNMPFFSVLFL